MARAFRPELFHDPDNIPYVLIPGDPGGGKCMIIEAMMRELLDDYDPNDMKAPDAPKSMFIEDYAAHATYHYCKADLAPQSRSIS